jgi:ATP-dependent Clp protease ATP-binding subunit ClpC
MSDGERLLKMEEITGAQIVGHERIIGRVADVIRRNYAGFAKNRPIGSFLFLGPTGVGKTELVKALADFLFGAREAMVRIDMSEFSEQHSSARLIGAPPGYVGHEEGGQLTEALRRKPFQIVLLDEVEKAHRDVLQILLQVLDDGRLTDGRGRLVDFTNTVIVMTSNLGSAHVMNVKSRRIGFNPQATVPDALDLQDEEELSTQILKSAREHFPPELWNRIEERLVFQKLTREQLRAIARLELKKSSNALLEGRGISYQAAEEIIDYLLEHGGYEPTLGARPLRQTIQRLIEGPIAAAILKGQFKTGETVEIALEGEKVSFKAATTS